MALRLIEMFLAETNEAQVQALLKEQNVLGLWHERLGEGQLMVKVLLTSEDSERVLDLLERHFAPEAGFRIVLLPVEAALPRPQPPEEPPAPAPAPAKKAARRISREELYADITDALRPSPVFVVMVALSAIVAAIGLLKDNVAVIIGAMVIAPLLGPNVGLALATTLGDFELARRALQANALGVVTALGLSVLVGVLFPVDPQLTELATRTRVGGGDIVLALASGVAGALAFTAGLSTTLIGVMVAVALLPPLATGGMLLGAGRVDLALGALLLLLTNVICVNLAGVTTFWFQGIRPATWWETQRARRATRWALALWVGLLAALILIVQLAPPR